MNFEQWLEEGKRQEELRRNACPRCGVQHKADSPHDAHELRYQSWFLREHGRLPTWEDAMAHCNEEDKDLCRQVIAAYGTNPRAIADLIWSTPRKKRA